MLRELAVMTLWRNSFAPLLLAALIAVSCFGPLAVSAQETGELTVTPVVVDQKAKSRDILKQSITITNSSNRKLNLYPSVNDVHAEDGTEAFVSAQSGAERSDSLANWIELSRGVIELSPGETREIPFVIRVNLNALPGTYHADISFFEGSNREGAEAGRPLAIVTVNTEVQADIKESMQLNKFITDNFFFSGDDVLFNYQLENIGNQDLKPKGEIRIYDRKGREVAAIPINSEGKSFTPDEAGQLAAAWSAAQGFGKFKAFLNIDYGNNQNGSLQDTVYFWIIPWQQLLAIFVVSLGAIIASALYFHRWLEHRHMQKFALAGAGAAATAGAMSMPAPAGMLVPPKPRAPIAPVMTMPPEVKEAKPVKKGMFSMFRRNKTAAVAPVSEPAAQAPVAEVVHEVPAPTPSIREYTPVAAAPASRAIDLSSTSVHQMPTEPKKQGHVINLKNGS